MRRFHEAPAVAFAAPKASNFVQGFCIEAPQLVHSDTDRSEGDPAKRARQHLARRAALMATPEQVSRHRPCPGTRTLSAESHRGAVRFFLQRVQGGLYVEREEIPRRGLRTLQSVQFTDAGQFGRWCDSDPIRFEHPLLHVNLKRDGDALWRDDDGNCAAP